MSIRHRPFRTAGYGLLVVATLATAAVRATRPERDGWFPEASVPRSAAAPLHLLAHAPDAQAPQDDEALDFPARLRAAHS